MFYKCTYCGDDATCFDHVVPRSYTSKGGARDCSNERTDTHRKTYTVPCCTECNSLLSSSFLTTIAERADYLSDAICRKNRKYLNGGTFTDEEISEFSPSLRKQVQAMQYLKQLTLDRVRHTNTVKYLTGLSVKDVWDSYL